MKTSNRTERKRCTMRVGLFVQKPCGKPARYRCAITHKPLCKDCVVEFEGKTISKEQYAILKKQQGYIPDKENFDNSADLYFWYYWQKQDFYNQADFTPFDEFDESAFESEEYLSWEETEGEPTAFDS
ncbi:MAG: hypothetical protein NZ551_06300 [Microscillaceae bacterium]|nr:hypothetical protein [Microscillaceae bacterium]MDW8460805.1 hypothetical protein [Cytophagales bacterium]